MEEVVSKHGEVLNSKELIKQIEELLNRHQCGLETSFDCNMMEFMDVCDLLKIRDNLINSKDNEIANNKEWLLNLAN